MPLYSYIALKQGKEVVRGEITASNLKDARDVLRKMGLVPTQINEAVDIKAKKATRLSSLSLSEKIDFISTLQILLTSGIPAVESLMFMEQEAAKKKIRDMSKILKTQIMAGSTFADTMARYPQVFGYIFIGLVKAGEESGELEKTLDRIKNLLEKQANIKGKVIGTLMYLDKDFQDTIDYMAAGKINMKPLISKVFKFEEYQDAYKYIENNKDTSLKVLIKVE